jgi:Uncharacterized homolog of gamma-carboxymuconolactone decarboxylase subunit
MRRARLGQFTHDILFGEVWERAELGPRDRSLMAVSAIVSTGRTAQIGAHADRGLDNGVKPEEIGGAGSGLSAPAKCGRKADMRFLFEPDGR